MNTTMQWALAVLLLACLVFSEAARAEPGWSETADEIRITTDKLEAAVRKRGYVSGVAAGSLVDKQTGAHDLGYGLDIVDWIMSGQR